MSVAALDQALMISSPEQSDQAFVVGTSFDLDAGHGGIESATLVATAHGAYEAELNGRSVDPRVLAPGWTSYQWRLQCQRYDVTELLAEHNTLSVEVGNGWWRGKFGFGDNGVDYGEDIGLIAALEIIHADGHRQAVTTSPQWQVTRSRTADNTLYHGQHIDLRVEPGDPRPARAVDLDRGTLVEQVDTGVVRHETIAPQRIWTSPAGKLLVDFGQNLVGWIRLTTPADPGREIVLRHAEVLEHGELGTRPLRHAKATDTIICSDTATVVEPSFTFHGFRYAEVTGWPGQLNASDLEAVVIHTDLHRTGHFRCSDEQVNQLERNMVWGLRGNTVDVPTDCPQRDERMGWTGDLAAIAPTAVRLYDMADMLHGWLLDLAAELCHNGVVPKVVPDIISLGQRPADRLTTPTCVWGDAAVWVPEALWQQYGDAERLAEHYPAMRRHLETIEEALSPTGLWDTGFQYADWLDPDAPPDRPGDAKADKGVVATACAYRSAGIVARAAGVLGRSDEQQRWSALAERVRAAFREHYVGPDGRITSDCATVYALAIHFDVLEGDLRQAAGDRLAELVREAGHRISTGFAGTPFVTWALTATGHVDDAYALLLQTECPSWLYPVTMGATTIWERWDSMLPDGTINPGKMTSFNHYALGAVSDWLHQVVGGIRAAAPGHAEIEFRPVPGPGLTWAETSLETRHGAAGCRWQIADGQLSVRVVAPEVPATLVLPNGETHPVPPGEHTFSQPWDSAAG